MDMDFARRATHKDGITRKAVWGPDQRLNAVAQYIQLGNMRTVCLVTGIPLATLNSWKLQPWWKELATQVRDEDAQQLDSNLKGIIDKAIKAVEERIDKGDHIFDQKTGKVRRVPIRTAVALKVTTELLARQDKIRAAPVAKELEKTIDARLNKLVDEFQRFAKGGTVTVTQAPAPEPESVVDIIPEQPPEVVGG